MFLLKYFYQFQCKNMFPIRISTYISILELDKYETNATEKTNWKTETDKKIKTKM